MLKRLMLKATLTSLACTLSLSAAALADAAKRLDVPAGELVAALESLAKQADIELVFQAEQLKGLRTEGLNGTYEPKEAVSLLIKGTKLILRTDESTGVMMIASPKATLTSNPSPGTSSASDPGMGVEPLSLKGRGKGEGKWRVARAEDQPQKTSTSSSDESSKDAENLQTLEEVIVDIPEILVTGSKSLNMDIKRSRDGAQPYVIFEREQIEESGALNVEGFLRNRLTAGSNVLSAAQSSVSAGANTSGFTLRGVGSGGTGVLQTLILVDGHRVAPRNETGTAFQADMNGIPLSAVERIEVLPTTASGIYGGSATGGVINIVMRRDYEGIQTTLSYENSFEGGGATRRIDFSAGQAFEEGRTNLLLAGSYSEGTPLYWGDRDFYERGIERILANNPGALKPGFFPPLGATTNICSATAFLPDFPQFGGFCNGATLVLDDGRTLDPGNTPLGDSFTFVPEGYAGPASDDGTALLENSASYNFNLAPTSQFDAARQGLLNAPTVKSLSLTLRREFTSRLKAFLDLSASENAGSFTTSGPVSSRFLLDAAAPVNPFNQTILVSTPAFGTDQTSSHSQKDYRGVAGLIFALPKQWQAEVDYTWNRTRTEQVARNLGLGAEAFTAVTSGTASGAPFDVFSDTVPLDFSQFLATQGNTTPPYHSILRDTTLRFAGPLGWALPGGMPKVSVLLEHRKEWLSDITNETPSFISLLYSRDQSIDSLYLETTIPLVSALNEMPGVKLLEVQLAARRDEYSITGANRADFLPGDTPPPPVRVTQEVSSTDPTLSLRYQPVADLTLRGSYSTGFLPPSLNVLVADPPTLQDGANFGLTDPKRDNTPVGIFRSLFAGNPNLQPEQSRSWSAGFILTPRSAPGLRLSADWIEIKKHDNVGLLFPEQINLENEDVLPGFITRAPLTPADIALGYTGGLIEEIDSRNRNMSFQTVEALDLAVDYRLESAAWGAFTVAVAATRNFHNVEQVFTGGPVSELVGTLSALPWQGNLELTWEKRAWTLRWNTRHFDSYCLQLNCVAGPVTDSQGSRRVSSQTYHDVALRYRFPEAGRLALLDGMDVRLGVKNVFNEKPPVDVSPGLPFYSTLGDPRLTSYYLSITKSFF